MTTRECSEAAEALLSWLESQEIKPAYSVPVLAIAMSAILLTFANGDRHQASALTKIAINLIRETVQQG